MKLNGGKLLRVVADIVDNKTEEILERIHPSVIQLGENGVLYIRYVWDNNYPYDWHIENMKEVRRSFEEAFPRLQIFVGVHDLQFTYLTQKDEFHARLAGDLRKEKNDEEKS